jgi:hypothetical protein
MSIYDTFLRSDMKKVKVDIEPALVKKSAAGQKKGNPFGPEQVLTLPGKGQEQELMGIQTSIPKSLPDPTPLQQQQQQPLSVASVCCVIVEDVPKPIKEKSPIIKAVKGMGTLKTFNQHQMIAISQALRFAAEAHKRQRRSDELQTPYINHIISVYEHLINYGFDNNFLLFHFDVLIAGILHDTLHDIMISEDNIRSRFGENVLSLLKECSYDDDDDKRKTKVERKIGQIRKASTISVDAAWVKKADMKCDIDDMLDPETVPSHMQQDEIDGHILWRFEVYSQLHKGPKDNGLDAELNWIWEDRGLTVLSMKERADGLSSYYKLLEERYGKSQ